MIGRLTTMTAALLLAGTSAATAQSAAGFVEPNAETNQIPSPSNTQPSDPSAGSYSEARTPTDPQKRSDRDAPGSRTEVSEPVQAFEGDVQGTRERQDEDR